MFGKFMLKVHAGDILTYGDDATFGSRSRSHANVYQSEARFHRRVSVVLLHFDDNHHFHCGRTFLCYIPTVYSFFHEIDIVAASTSVILKI